jgi:peptidoglycan/xylan/chitin deacetylase (PgdA/CDA1 family)
MGTGIAVLMYHELATPGRPLCQADPGYRRYVVPASAFQEQLTYLKALGYAGISMGEALKGPQDKPVVLTFDDGCESDLRIAAPLLASLGLTATFYITAGFLGRPAFMTESQLRKLSAAGFEIGCHSMTHPYLTELDAAGLHQEIVEAKERLEQIVGHAVEHYSCPGGRFDGRVVAKVKEAGYATLAHSQARLYSSEGNRYSIGRIPVLCNTSPEEIGNICDGRGLWVRALSQQLRSTAQSLLGNRLYNSVRDSLLSRSE